MEQKELFLKIAEIGNIDRKKYPFIIIGIKNYYKDNSGVPDSSRVYEDSIIIDSINTHSLFNANLGDSIGQGIYYAHRFCFAGGLKQTGEINSKYGCDITRGNKYTREDNNFLMVYPEQYNGFIELTKSELIRLFTPQGYDKVDIPYILLDLGEPEAPTPLI